MINLQNAAILSVNGAVEESDPQAALYYYEVSFPTQVRLFYGYGAATATSFTPGSQVPKVIVSLNLQTGFWQSNTGLTGAVSGAGFTTAQSDFLALENMAETFVTNAGVIVGTTTPWTAAAF
jgi:hypothetical protein